MDGIPKQDLGNRVSAESLLLRITEEESTGEGGGMGEEKTLREGQFDGLSAVRGPTV